MSGTSATSATAINKVVIRRILHPQSKFKMPNYNGDICMEGLIGWDGMGTVTSLSISSGSLAKTYIYDSFGKLLSASGSISRFIRQAQVSGTPPLATTELKLLRQGRRQR